MRLRWLGVVVALCLGSGSLSAGTARAGGFEYAASGTRSLGRGGAWYARADDTTALLYNPANLATLPGTQLALNAQLAFFGACFDRAGVYTQPDVTIYQSDDSRFGNNEVPPPDGYFGVEFPEVCNDGPPGPGANLVMTLRLSPELGIGFGIVTPAAVGHTVWGDPENGTVPVAGAPTGRLPSPARYNLVEEQLLIFYPTVGAGYSPTPWLRFGVALSWGMGLFDFTNVTAPYAGEHPGLDVWTKLSAQDLFIPRVNAAIAVTPIDQLDVMLGFTWTDDVSAGGELDVSSTWYRDAPLDHKVVDGVALEAPQPWQIALGVRFADRFTPRPRDPSAVQRLSGRVEDTMANERWDIELDVIYELNSRVDDFVVTVPTDSLMVDVGAEVFLPPRTVLPHNWKDQLSLRLGGDYNVIPGLAAVRLGFSFETRGVDERYTQIDFMPLQRFGVHAGLTVRLGRLDVSLAYAHLFQETIEMTNGQLPQVVADRMASSNAVTIVNNGTFESNFDVLALEVGYHL